MELRLRDPRSASLGLVAPARGCPLTMYVCGPTVYGHAHVGHGRNYLVFDIVRRHLETNGVRVRHVMNITDFEDRIFERARALGIPWRTVARRAERRFLADLAGLGVRMPHRIPRASDHVPEMREAARRLERTGRVRREHGDLLYRPPERRASASPFADDIVRHAVADPTTGSPSPDASIRDFAVWQAPRPGSPRWPSPWGPGIPGWHVECYVMARRYLGLPVDLHGGGRDLLFPHHFAENEIAVALDRVPFARRYLHDAFVLQDGAKMAKSTGILVGLRAATEEHGAGAVRWYLLSTHYSQSLEWEGPGVASAAEELETVRHAVRTAVGPGTGTGRALARLRSLVREVGRCVANDLDTPGALGALRSWAGREAASPASGLARGDGPAARRMVREIESRLGIPLASGDRRLPPSRPIRTARRSR
ncbi:MAG TPA: hypothetical protein VLY85_01240 [Thermoplasmata archaeon]|nr:hypothetical protein [Thermoplasmata archaeon]